MWPFKKKEKMDSEEIKSIIRNVNRVHGAMKCVEVAPKYGPTVETAVFVLEKVSETLEAQQLWAEKLERQLTESLEQRIKEQKEHLEFSNP